MAEIVGVAEDDSDGVSETDGVADKVGVGPVTVGVGVSEEDGVIVAESVWVGVKVDEGV